MLIGREQLPMEAMDAALLAPIRFLFPKAPAEGLTLLGAGFAANTNGQVWIAPLPCLRSY